MYCGKAPECIKVRGQVHAERMHLIMIINIIRLEGYGYTRCTDSATEASSDKRTAQSPLGFRPVLGVAKQPAARALHEIIHYVNSYLTH